MTPSEWDAHKAKYCAKCVHNRRGSKACTVIVVMEKNPKDKAAAHIFARLGMCSQHQQKPPKKNKEEPEAKEKIVGTGKD